MEQNTFEKNQIIAYFDEYDYLVDKDDQAVYSYRKYLGEANDGFFIIQDFYSESHKIYSNEIKINTLEYIDKFYLPSCIEGKLTYWHKNGRKFREENYINGIEEGVYTEWYENGQKSIEVNYINGIKEGIHAEWYENGQKKYEINFINELQNGKYSSWYKNGQKHSEKNYINDVLTGEALYWHEDGQKSTYEVVLEWGGPYAEFGIIDHFDYDKNYTYGFSEKCNLIKVDDSVIDQWWKSLSNMKSYIHCYNRPDLGLDRYGVTLIPPESLGLLYDIVANETREDFKSEYPTIFLELLTLIKKAKKEGKYIIHFGV